MKHIIRSFITSTLLGLIILFASQQAHGQETSKEIVLPYWSIVYTRKDMSGWSEAANNAWSEKQRYDRALFNDGKIFMAGLFKPGGKPKDWVVFLQPMKKSEAQKIMENDPSIKGGFATAEIRMFVTTLQAPQKTQ